MSQKLMCVAVGLAAACSVLTDAAVDLATCIRKGVDEMSRRGLPTHEVDCPVRAKRTVTAILAPSTGVPSEADITALRQMGVPHGAIYYAGPDTPSVGRPVSLGPVYVYDRHFADNRKYSTSSALGSQVRIATLMTKTGDHFVVLLHRRSDGVVEVIGLQ